MTILDIPGLVERARDIVLAADKRGELNQLTHRKVRQEIENELHLDAGILDAPEYRKPLKSAIAEALAARRKKQSPSGSTASRKNVDNDDETEAATKKMPSSTTKGAGSKQFKSAELVSSDVELEGGKGKASKKPTSTGNRRVELSDLESSDAEVIVIRPKEVKNDENSGSEMSVLIDEPPKKKKSSKTEPKSTSRGPTKQKKPAESLNKDEETAVAEVIRPKKEVKNDENSGSEMSVLIDEPPKKRKSSKTEPKSTSRGSTKQKKAAEPLSKGEETTEAEAIRPKKEVKNDENSGSEMSVLIDEPPKKKKSSKTESKSSSRGQTKQKKPAEPLSKDEETIKRLKSLVVACGIRKVWSKVFEGIDRPSQQIKKLKEILSDLGMKGRYSLEQAKAIKEKRELAQELEDVQTFEKAVVGKKRASPQSDPEESESDDVPEPKRRKGRNARQSIMAFLQDQSESE